MKEHSKIERWGNLRAYEQCADEREIEAMLTQEQNGVKMQGGTCDDQIFLLTLQLGQVSL